jgi:hypothetical protein
MILLSCGELDILVNHHCSAKRLKPILLSQSIQLIQATAIVEASSNTCSPVVDNWDERICMSLSCHGANARYAMQRLVLIQEELAKEGKNRTQRSC